MSDKEELYIRDFIYFDFKKAVSIFSQIKGGLITEMQTKAEEEVEHKGTIGFDIKLLKSEFGGTDSEKTSILESKVLHHDLYTRIENFLFKKNFAIDISKSFNDKDLDYEKAFALIRQKYYLHCEGWAVFEDYKRMKNISVQFNEIKNFINKCAASTVEQSEEFKSVLSEIDELEIKLKSEKDRNLRAKKKSMLNSLKTKLRSEIDKQTKVDDIPEWFLGGMKLFIDTFIPNRLNIRIYPYDSHLDFHIISNLKRDCFVDADLENILFAYGTRPNIKLSIFGLITSLPHSNDIEFDPTAEFNIKEESGLAKDQRADIEKGFRGMFEGLHGFEKLVRFSKYPKITVYPIAVFRNIASITNHKEP